MKIHKSNFHLFLSFPLLLALTSITVQATDHSSPSSAKIEGISATEVVSKVPGADKLRHELKMQRDFEDYLQRLEKSEPKALEELSQCAFRMGKAISQLVGEVLEEAFSAKPKKKSGLSLSGIVDPVACVNEVLQGLKSEKLKQEGFVWVAKIFKEIRAQAAREELGEDADDNQEELAAAYFKLDERIKGSKINSVEGAFGEAKKWVSEMRTKLSNSDGDELEAALLLENSRELIHRFENHGFQREAALEIESNFDEANWRALDRDIKIVASKRLQTERLIQIVNEMQRGADSAGN